MNTSDAIQSALHGMPTLITGGVPKYRAGEEKLAWNHANLSGPDSVIFRSESFSDGAPIPKDFSVDGKNISPALSWEKVTESAKSIALVVEDPDAPTPEPYVHWLVYNLPPTTLSLPAGAHIAKDAEESTGPFQGKNSGLKTGWTGMAPPKGDTPHRYFFQIFALDAMLPLKPAAGRTALFEAMAGKVIGRGRLVGTYQR